MNFFNNFENFFESSFLKNVKNHFPVDSYSFENMPITIPANTKINGKITKNTITGIVCNSDVETVTICIANNFGFPSNSNDFDKDDELNLSRVEEEMITISRNEFKKLLTPDAPANPGGIGI